LAHNKTWMYHLRVWEIRISFVLHWLTCFFGPKIGLAMNKTALFSLGILRPTDRTNMDQYCDGHGVRQCLACKYQLSIPVDPT
jgi:hypothetical protein